jgi:hypothetical protein
MDIGEAHFDVAPCMGGKSLEHSRGVRAVRGPRGLKLIGEADELIAAFDDLRSPSVPEDDVLLGPWRLTSSVIVAF